MPCTPRANALKALLAADNIPHTSVILRESLRVACLMTHEGLEAPQDCETMAHFLHHRLKANTGLANSHETGFAYC